MKKTNYTGRRRFLKVAAQAGIVTGFSATGIHSFANMGMALSGSGNQPGAAGNVSYSQQPLGYGYQALEPYIDAQTMEIHYTKHGAGYAKNLSEAVQAEGVNTQQVSLETLLGNISRYSTKMRNNAGGHYNHELFWKSMGTPSVHQPEGSLAQAITRDFGSFEAFRTQFSDAGKARFGSGWAWLIATPGKKLVVGSTPNQDNPLMDLSNSRGIPLLGLDVWEHAYYLKYQNRRADYINGWWNVVDWTTIQQRFNQLG